jgi:hypothetical protein
MENERNVVHLPDGRASTMTVAQAREHLRIMMNVPDATLLEAAQVLLTEAGWLQTQARQMIAEGQKISEHVGSRIRIHTSREARP